MTPDDRQAMFAAWKAIHKGVRPDCFPSVTHTGEKMFSAGLAHARSEREASAAEIERLTAERETIESSIMAIPNPHDGLTRGSVIRAIRARAKP